jgi:hypothetical protein
MGGCDSVTYHNVTQNVFDCLKKKLEHAGVKVPAGNEGEIEGNGVKGHFKWDGATNLTITITSKPLILPCGTIMGKLNDTVNDCGGST